MTLWKQPPVHRTRPPSPNPTANRQPSPNPTVHQPPNPTANQPSSDCQLGEEQNMYEFGEEDLQSLTDLLEVIGENEDFPTTSTDCDSGAQLWAYPMAIFPAGTTPAPIFPADPTPTAIIPAGSTPAPILSGDLTQCFEKKFISKK